MHKHKFIEYINISEKLKLIYEEYIPFLENIFI